MNGTEEVGLLGECPVCRGFHPVRGAEPVVNPEEEAFYLGTVNLYVMGSHKNESGQPCKKGEGRPPVSFSKQEDLD